MLFKREIMDKTKATQGFDNYFLKWKSFRGENCIWNEAILEYLAKYL